MVPETNRESECRGNLGWKREGEKWRHGCRYVEQRCKRRVTQSRRKMPGGGQKRRQEGRKEAAKRLNEGRLTRCVWAALSASIRRLERSVHTLHVAFVCREHRRGPSIVFHRAGGLAKMAVTVARRGWKTAKTGVDQAAKCSGQRQ